MGQLRLFLGGWVRFLVQWESLCCSSGLGWIFLWVFVLGRLWGASWTLKSKRGYEERCCLHGWPVDKLVGSDSSQRIQWIARMQTWSVGWLLLARSWVVAFPWFRTWFWVQSWIPLWGWFCLRRLCFWKWILTVSCLWSWTMEGCCLPDQVHWCRNEALEFQWWIKQRIKLKWFMRRS